MYYLLIVFTTLIATNVFAEFRSDYKIDDETSSIDQRNRPYRGMCVKLNYLRNDYFSPEESQSYAEIIAFIDGVFPIPEKIENKALRQYFHAKDRISENACKRALNIEPEPTDFKEALYKEIRLKAAEEQAAFKHQILK